MADRFALAFALVLVGCPTVKEIGDKPQESGTASATDGGAEEGADSSGASTVAGSGESGELEFDGMVDCAALSADDEIVAGGELNAFGFPPRCNPRESGTANHMCCSDDPQAVEGALPAYLDRGIDGEVPIFAAFNNGIGTWGLCVNTGAMPAESGLHEPPVDGCPIPCNPTWSTDEIFAVCGSTNASCCQTQELQPEDCVQDRETDLWRPVTGEDIGDSTDWAPDRHTTHQDPGGPGCTTFAGGTGEQNDVWFDCIRHLTVADQRGFCMYLEPGQLCPHEAPGYVDACTQINMGLIPPPV